VRGTVGEDAGVTADEPGLTIRADTARTDTVLLDLDGTLVNSAPGILGSLRQAFAELDLPLPDGGLPRTLLGPPLYVSLPALVGGGRAPELLATYRRIYGERGLLQSAAFDGIDALLRELAAAGVTTAVATSKAEVYAERIVADRGWTDLFATVCGDTLDGRRPTKADVVGEALYRLGQPTTAIMVGDRSHDVVGAREHGLDCLGAGWGYAAPGELEEAGAVAVYAEVGDLRKALLA
jgi:phosphoglycolate phosphatase